MPAADVVPERLAGEIEKPRLRSRFRTHTRRVSQGLERELVPAPLVSEKRTQPAELHGLLGAPAKSDAAGPRGHEHARTICKGGRMSDGRIAHQTRGAGTRIAGPCPGHHRERLGVRAPGESQAHAIDPRVAGSLEHLVDRPVEQHRDGVDPGTMRVGAAVVTAGDGGSRDLQSDPDTRSAAIDAEKSGGCVRPE